LELPAGKSPREWGRLHGESFRGDIRALAEIRIYLCTKVGGFSGREPVLAAAKAHLPVLERYDRALYEELIGIAEGADVSPEEIVVANHYTDLRDLDPDPKSWQLAGDTAGCSMMWSPGILAQTWDMHASAIPYVILLATPDAKLLTVTGCLGMCGMNSARVGLTINNLFSTDARIGAVWPAIVRRALREPSAAQAFDVIRHSPIGSGRHYFVADRHGAHALEASGTRQTVLPTGGAYCHTNHSLRPEIAAHSKVPATSTTHTRMQWLEADLARGPVRDLADAWKRLGDGVDVDQSTPEAPHAPATCGAIAMDLQSGDVWAQQGHIRGLPPERFHV
jgi:isopenicillin-N N-acyltransferase-like protein